MFKNINIPQVRLIAIHNLSLIPLISLCIFSLTCIADQKVLIHEESDLACSELLMESDVYHTLTNAGVQLPKGKCPLVHPNGKEVFGGCRESDEITAWYYDAPEYYEEANFKTSIKNDCDDWLPVTLHAK